MTTEELKPCPLCHSADVAGYVNAIDIHDNPVNGIVECRECGCSIEKEDLCRAGEIWNHRPSPWISVKEKRPEVTGNFLVAIDHPGFPSFEVAYFDGDEWCFIGNAKKFITHWMKIPQLPGEE